MGCHCLLRNKAQEALKKKFINACKVQPLHVQQTPLLVRPCHLQMTSRDRQGAGPSHTATGRKPGVVPRPPRLRSHVGAAPAARLAAPSPGAGEQHTKLPQTRPAAEGPLLRLHPPTCNSGEFTRWLSPLPDLQSGLVWRREETQPPSAGPTLVRTAVRPHPCGQACRGAQPRGWWSDQRHLLPVRDHRGPLAGGVWAEGAWSAQGLMTPRLCPRCSSRALSDSCLPVSRVSTLSGAWKDELCL